MGHFSVKNVFTILFRISNLVQIIFLDKGKTNHLSYIEDCLKHLVCTCDVLKNVKFHHARPHVHMNLKKYSESHILTEMDRPSYFQDITLSYFWLFDYIMQRINIHSDGESLRTGIVSSIPNYEYRKIFNKQLERIQYCINYEENYCG